MKQIHLSCLLLMLMLFTASCTIQYDPKPTTQVIPITEAIFKIEEASDVPIADYIRNVFQDKNGNLWFGTNGYGVAHFNGDILVYFSTEQGFNGGQVTGITEDVAQNIWFATNEGVVKYDWSNTPTGEKQFSHVIDREDLDGSYVWSIFADSKGVIWVGTSNGVRRFDGAKLVPLALSYTTDEQKSDFIANRTIWSITEDKAGNIWFGTNGDGAFKYDGNAFTHFTKADGLTDDCVDNILQASNGDYWFGTRFGGVSRYDGKAFTNYKAPIDIGNNEVCVMYEDKAGNIWFSSEGYGVYRYNGRSFANFSEAEGLPIKAVQTIFEDQEGRLWIGGGGGLYRYDRMFFRHVSKDGPWD